MRGSLWNFIWFHVEIRKREKLDIHYTQLLCFVCLFLSFLSNICFFYLLSHSQSPSLWFVLNTYSSLLGIYWQHKKKKSNGNSLVVERSSSRPVIRFVFCICFCLHVSLLGKGKKTYKQPHFLNTKRMLFFDFSLHGKLIDNREKKGETQIFCGAICS